MQGNLFNTGIAMTGVPMFQLPIMHPAWMDLYNQQAASQAGLLSPSQPSPKKKGFSIADILSEERPTSHQDTELRRVASHPYFPLVHDVSNHSQHYTNDRQVMRQCRNKRVRTIFTPEQLEQLEKIFEKQQYMVGTERYYLASKLHLSEAQVKVWFQNRRIKWRKQTGLEGSRVSEADEFSRTDCSDTCSESGFSDTGSL